MSEGRKQLTPKYRGIYDKAMGGHSPKSAIHAGCLICLGCDTKAIKNCAENKTCPFWPYRPYQDKTKRPRKRNLTRINTDEKGRFTKKPGGPVAKDIIIPNVSAGKLRLRVLVEQEKK